MSEGSPIELVIARLQGVRPSGDSGRQWTACCPAHDDALQSLAVARGADERVLLKCYAGCETRTIVAAINLELKDLFPQQKEKPLPAGVSVGSLAFDKRIPVEFLRDTCSLTDKLSGSSRIVMIPYKGEDGDVLFVRERSALRAKEGSKQPRGVNLQAYGRWRLPAYREAGGTLIIVEGESDAWTLWLHGYPAIGLPGASAIKGLAESDLVGFDTVYVWRDADDAGAKFVAAVASKVAELRPGATVRMLSSPEVKDPNELQQRFAPEFKTRFDAILAAAVVPPAPVKAGDNADTTGFPLTDMGNAQRLVAKHGKDLRYAEEMGQWYVWDGTRWRPRKVGSVVQRAKATVRGIVGELTGETEPSQRTRILQHALASESAKSIRNMVSLTESETAVVVEPGDLDADRFLLNVENGVIDLRTGELRPHRREDLLTKKCPVVYDPDAKCPAWKVFMARIFAVNPNDSEDRGDADLIQFVKRLFGYALTGDVGEQILPIFWGGGSNGKSTLLNVVREIMGRGYAAKAPRGLLMTKRNDSHPTELTVMFGARLVIATESGRGHRLSEELVKDLTGGEAISARKMKQDFFEFEPTHKLLLCTNHRPRIPESDDGIWRRVMLVPFKAKFWNPAKDEIGPDHLRRDNNLAAKLRLEFPGILAWLVRGCLEWQRNGLGAPKTVVKETEAYKAEEDRVGEFLSECCERSNSVGNTPFKEVFAAYCRWSDESGYRPLGRTEFSNDIRARGVAIDRGAKNKLTCFSFRLVDVNTDNKKVSNLGDLDE